MDEEHDAPTELDFLNYSLTINISLLTERGIMFIRLSICLSLTNLQPLPSDLYLSSPRLH